MSDQSNVPADATPAIPNTLSPTDRALFGEAHYRAIAAAHALSAAKTEVDAAAQRQQSINAMLANKYALTDADRLDIATGKIMRNAVPAEAPPVDPMTEALKRVLADAKRAASNGGDVSAELRRVKSIAEAMGAKFGDAADVNNPLTLAVAEETFSFVERYIKTRENPAQ
jgi:hypothetical protein